MTQILNVLARKSNHVETIEPDEPLSAAVSRMSECGIGSVVVVEDGHPIGIVTERDVLVHLANGVDRLRAEVREIMSAEFAVVEPTTSIADALALISARHQRHLPVIDGSKLCGLVSLGDLTAWLVRDQEQTIRDLYDFITH
jgi:CBS domain-containing protein